MSNRSPGNQTNDAPKNHPKSSQIDQLLAAQCAASSARPRLSAARAFDELAAARAELDAERAALEAQEARLGALALQLVRILVGLDFLNMFVLLN
jgi:hypothetical protein